MLGTVAELAFVSDPLINCLLSWFLQHKMSVALTTTSEQQRKVYDAGFPSYCEATLFAFSRNNYDGSSGARLPIELPKPPATFNSSIEFAVNLLEFSDENARLRCSLYWALLGKTIVLSDLKSGQIYREHLVRMKQQCPTILTKDGNMIASDGLMDPKKTMSGIVSKLENALRRAAAVWTCRIPRVAGKGEKPWNVADGHGSAGGRPGSHSAGGRQAEAGAQFTVAADQCVRAGAEKIALSLHWQRQFRACRKT